MSELKLSPYQNERVTDLLCSSSLVNEQRPNGLKVVREAVVAELLAVNAVTADAGRPSPPLWMEAGRDPAAVFEEVARDLECMQVVGKPPTQSYAGDDYPREGCTITLTVQPSGMVRMRVYEPTCPPPGRPIESYREMRQEAVATAVTDWLSGRKPRLDGPHETAPCAGAETLTQLQAELVSRLLCSPEVASIPLMNPDRLERLRESVVAELRAINSLAAGSSPSADPKTRRNEG